MSNLSNEVKQLHAPMFNLLVAARFNYFERKWVIFGKVTSITRGTFKRKEVAQET